MPLNIDSFLEQTYHKQDQADSPEREFKIVSEEEAAIKMITKVKIVQQNCPLQQNQSNGCPLKPQVQLTRLPEVCEDVSMKSECSFAKMPCFKKCSDLKMTATAGITSNCVREKQLPILKEEDFEFGVTESKKSKQLCTRSAATALCKELRSKRLEKVKRYLDKKRRRLITKSHVYQPRKQVAEKRLRIKGRFVTKEQAFQILGVSQQELLSIEDVQMLLTKLSNDPVRLNTIFENGNVKGQIKIHNFNALIDQNFILGDGNDKKLQEIIDHKKGRNDNYHLKLDISQQQLLSKQSGPEASIKECIGQKIAAHPSYED